MPRETASSLHCLCLHSSEIFVGKIGGFADFFPARGVSPAKSNAELHSLLLGIFHNPHLLEVGRPDGVELAHVVEAEEVGADDVARRERHALDVRHHRVHVRLSSGRRREVS